MLANIQIDIEIGFLAQVASWIDTRIIKGAAKLLLQEKTHAEKEIDIETMPKGFTIADSNKMQH